MIIVQMQLKKKMTNYKKYQSLPDVIIEYLSDLEKPFYWVFLLKLTKHYGQLIEEVLSEHNTGTNIWCNAFKETCQYFGLVGIWDDYVSLNLVEIDYVDAVFADRCLNRLKELEVKYVEVD